MRQPEGVAAIRRVGVCNIKCNKYSFFKSLLVSINKLFRFTYYCSIIFKRRGIVLKRELCNNYKCYITACVFFLFSSLSIKFI